MPSEILGVAPWAIITGILSWFGSMYVYRAKRIDKRTETQAEHDERMSIHRDELTFQLLQNARLEMASARIEVEDLRDEVRKLRSMENHFYHFQQSLDHLEALLFAASPEDRLIAERNARAFLTRMRRLNEAKGTIANEVQRIVSEGEIGVFEPKDKKPKGGKNADG